MILKLINLVHIFWRINDTALTFDEHDEPIQLAPRVTLTLTFYLLQGRICYSGGSQFSKFACWCSGEHWKKKGKEIWISGMTNKSTNSAYRYTKSIKCSITQQTKLKMVIVAMASVIQLVWFLRYWNTESKQNIDIKSIWGQQSICQLETRTVVLGLTLAGGQLFLLRGWQIDLFEFLCQFKRWIPKQLP